MDCCHEAKQCADLARLEMLIKNHEKEVYAHLLKQDNRIAELCCKFNGDIQKAIYEYLLVMEKEGKLQEIITDTLLNDLLVQKFRTEGLYNIKEFGAIGDGFHDDTEAIQKAIDTAHAAGGGTVIVPASEGEFRFSAITVRSGVTFRGVGGVLKLKNSYCLNANAKYYLIKNDGDNVSIVDLIIDGNKDHNKEFTVADAITVSGKNIRVTGCTIMNPPDSGIMFSCAENSVCSDNVIFGAPDCGIYINNNGRSDLLMGSRCDRNVVRGCYTGIALKRVVQQMSVCGNVVQDCEYGITHENASSDRDFSTDTMINDNMIISTALTAIVLRGSNRCTVNGNYINGFTYVGIELQGCEKCAISGNTLKAAIPATKRHGAAINLTVRTGLRMASRYNTISGNTFDVGFSDPVYQFAYIAIEGDNDAGSDHNVVIGNTGTGSVPRAVTLAKANNNQIANNTLKGAKNAIVTSGNTGNLIQNNKIDGATTAIYDAPIIGITPYGSRIFVNLLTTKPNFAANNHDICISKAPYANGCIGWTYYNGSWRSFGAITG